MLVVVGLLPPSLMLSLLSVVCVMLLLSWFGVCMPLGVLFVMLLRLAGVML